MSETPTGMTSDYSDGVPVVAYCLIGAEGRVVAARHPDEVFYSASTIKTAVLIAVLAAVERSEHSLDEQLVVTHTFQSAVSGAGSFDIEFEETDQGLGAPGDVVSLAYVLRRMIVVSANCATNMAAGLVGLDRVNAALADAGATRSAMQRPFSDAVGLEAGLSNFTTARDLATMMYRLRTGTVLGPDATDFALTLMREQEFPNIGLEVEDYASASGITLDWGSKSGGVSAIKHDAAFFGVPDKAPYALAVCTRAYDRSEGAEVIRAVTAAALSLTDIAHG